MILHEASRFVYSPPGDLHAEDLCIRWFAIYAPPGGTTVFELNRRIAFGSIFAPEGHHIYDFGKISTIGT